MIGQNGLNALNLAEAEQEQNRVALVAPAQCLELMKVTLMYAMKELAVELLSKVEVLLRVCSTIYKFKILDRNYK